MKPLKKAPSARTATEQPEVIARGKTATKAMPKELRAEHQHWNLPLLFGEYRKVLATKPLTQQFCQDLHPDPNGA